MDYIGNEEEKQDHDHSFRPEGFPENVSQAPMTEEEKQHINEAYDQGQKFRRYPRTTRYLPCHYFDHICGSSTGGYPFSRLYQCGFFADIILRLIAIMLGRFRMAVPDCLFEYRKLGQEVFGKPRMVSTLRFGLGVRHKYNAARLENVFKDVAIRRNELPQPHETGKITFPSGRGLCAT